MMMMMKHGTGDGLANMMLGEWCRQERTRGLNVLALLATIPYKRLKDDDSFHMYIHDCLHVHPVEYLHRERRRQLEISFAPVEHKGGLRALKPSL